MPTKYVIAAGGLALGLALLYSMNLVPELDFWHLVLFRAAQTAALALLFVPISTIAYATIPPELNGDATALFSMARNVFGGIGISVSTALVTEHLQIRQAHLVHAPGPGNQPYNVLLQQVQQALIDAGQSSAQATQMAPGQVFQMLRDQVAVLAYNDVFLITACLSFIMIPTALFMSGIKTKVQRRRPLTDAPRPGCALLVPVRLLGRPRLHAAQAARGRQLERPSAQRSSRHAVSTQTNPDPKWWDGFNDPVLTAADPESHQRQPRPAAGGAARRRSPAERGRRRRRRPAQRQRQRQLHARTTRPARPAAVAGRQTTI